jgi:hypothetical protein
MPNRIHSKGPFVHEEYTAGNALIKPGMLLDFNVAGSAVVPHAISGGEAEAMFAEEDALQGKTVDDLYANASIVSVIIPNKGSEIRALIKDGQDITPGDELQSNGDGTLIKRLDYDSGALTTTHTQTVAVAQEAAAPSGADALARVRIV